MEFDQLWPRARRVDVQRYVEELELTRRALDDRPFTVVNFVSSIDGRASVNGRSGTLGDDGDRALFRALRAEVDAVLVGTGTLEAEGYGRLIRDPEVRERRRQRGLRPEPLLCTLTRRGSLPLEIPLFAEPELQVVVFSGAEIDVADVAAQVEIITLPLDQLTFAVAFAHLRARHDVRALLCEGGPRVFGALAGEEVVDQLFLTLANRFAGGGDAPTIASGAELVEPLTLDLGGVLERDGTLFLRYEFPN